MKKIDLRPYPGYLFLCRKESEMKRVMKNAGIENRSLEAGLFVFDGNVGNYAVWAKDQVSMVHEVSHVVLHLFDRIGCDPREGNGEPFCYMLTQLLREIWAAEEQWTLATIKKQREMKQRIRDGKQE